MSETPKIKVIPPLTPIGTMSIGFVAHLFVPVPLVAGIGTMWIGLAILILSFVPVGLGVQALRAARTTVDVRRSPASLVTSGIFNLTRNPMYLAIMLLCVGLALIMNSLIMLLFVVPTGSALCLAFIRKEEAILEQQFGQPYIDYLHSVRRWI
ncbi:methyltransferase family protein [Kordiimonas sp.]|uniref:methyltransferase family protein n=1 Tax=Kordiimonas sp. TaxID=1970157 RepID=UPI003A8F9572